MKPIFRIIEKLSMLHLQAIRIHIYRYYFNLKQYELCDVDTGVNFVLRGRVLVKADAISFRYVQRQQAR